MLDRIKTFFKNNSLLLSIYAVLILLFFGTNAFLNFNSDTYIVQENTALFAKDMVFRNGRPIIGAVYALIWFFLHLSVDQFYMFSYILAIVCLFLALFLYSKMLFKKTKNIKLSILLPFIIICNPLIVEYFMFIEKGCFCLSILLSVCATYFLNIYLEKQKKSFLLFCLICLLLIALTYQGILSLFVAISLPVIIEKKDTFNNLVKKMFFIIVFFIIGALVSVLYGKLFNVERASLSVNVMNIMTIFLKSYGRMFYSFGGLLPAFLPLIIFLALFTVIIFILIRNRKKLRNELLIISFIILVVPVCAFSPLLIGASDWLTARTVYSFGCIFGLLTFEIFRLINHDDYYKVLQKLLFACCVCFMCFQFFNFNKIYISKYQNDTGDQYTAKIINEAIIEHEEKNHTKISKLIFYYDSHPDYNRYDVFWRNQDYVVSSFNTDWSKIQSINFFNNTSYETINNNKYENYCSTNNWDTFSYEQLIFEKDTLYICVY